LILDSSAVVSMIIEEPGHHRLLDATADAAEVAIGAPTLVETDMVMVGRFGLPGQALVAQFLERNDVVVVAFDEAHRHASAEAFIRYGKGRHSASLNYGDCMTYAIARVAEHPLLFIGKDFAKTDIPVALS
jgi:ribonuclease VapC